MDKPSLKKDLIYNFWNIADLKQLGTQRLQLVTASGLISGVPARLPVDTEYDELVGTQILAKYYVDAVKNYRSRHGLSGTESVPGNDGAIVLQDVVITNTSGTIDIPFLVVFFDQIIGVSLGNI
ncbi:hypothetical protein SAMN05443270_1107 [Lacrimispora sphenoides]|uniref:hypothetical protein n=1 Tax=Lacrimispora sphenoides TaxID=29370 RepID=UPI0008CA613D|nr:hypothetical protein [Lacrimispora sphenoides]SET71964.1 hypothetical protein SAMN05443270_1107 [Lacrimispora sphenoides]